MLSGLDRAKCRDVLRDLHDLKYKNRGVLEFDAFAEDAFDLIDARYHDDIVKAWLSEQAQEIFTQPSRNSGSKNNDDGRQGKFWNDTKLHARYNVKRDGKTVGVATGDLTFMEFSVICDRRRSLIKTDQAHLDELERHLKEVRPYWLEHPDLTFAEVFAAVFKDAA